MQIRQITPKQSCSAVSLVLPGLLPSPPCPWSRHSYRRFKRTLMEKEQQPSSWNIKGKSDTAKKKPLENLKYSSLSCQQIVLETVCFLSRGPCTMIYVIKECHLRMLTMELCPQGSWDLVQQVVLSFSAALPSVPSAALALLLQRLSLSHHPLPDAPHTEEPLLHPAQHCLTSVVHNECSH